MDFRPQDSIAIREGGRHEKILVVQTSFLGDVVLTLPLIAEIKRRFPDSWLSVLCKAQVKGLLEDHAAIDEVLAFDKTGAQRGFRSLWDLAQNLKQREFTIAISPHKSFRTALLLFLAGIPRRVGFCQSAAWFLYHDRVSRPAAMHDVERNLSILRALGIDLSDCRRSLCLEVNPEIRQAVAATFHSLGITKRAGTLIFGFSPGSVWPMKRWSLRGYADVILNLKKTYACEVLLFGAPEDHQTVAELQQLTGHCALNLVGRFSLRELASAIEWCDLFICNDTGPMHVAVARRVPVVAIFCATTPALGFYPYSSRAIVVEKRLHCRPCSSHGGVRCPLGTEDCIRLITPEHVLNAVQRLLSGARLDADSEGTAFIPQFMTL
jgi:heptosyltransferase-2